MCRGGGGSHGKFLSAEFRENRSCISRSLGCHVGRLLDDFIVESYNLSMADAGRLGQKQNRSTRCDKRSISVGFEGTEETHS